MKAGGFDQFQWAGFPECGQSSCSFEVSPEGALRCCSFRPLRSALCSLPEDNEDKNSAEISIVPAKQCSQIPMTTSILDHLSDHHIRSLGNGSCLIRGYCMTAWLSIRCIFVTSALTRSLVSCSDSKTPMDISDLSILGLAGKSLIPQEHLYKQNVLLLRGQFRPFTLLHNDMLMGAAQQFFCGPDETSIQVYLFHPCLCSPCLSSLKQPV